MSQDAFLIEIIGSDAAIYGFTTGRGFAPTDADPALDGAFYQPRVAASGAPVISRETDGAGSTGGAGGLSFGTITLNNADGALDGLGDLGFDGRALTIRFLPSGSRTMAEATTLYRGTVTELQVSRDSVRITARDRFEELNVPAGALIDAAEWPDAEGQRMPVCAGKPLNVPFVWLDRVKLIAALHDGPGTVDAAVGATGGVYDLGVGLDREADYADMAALQATAPTAGHYKLLSDASGLYVRLGSRPDDYGKMAADVVLTSPNGPAQIQAIAQRAETIGSGDIDAASFTALSRAWDVGGYWPGETTILEAVSEIAASIGAVIFFGRTGTLKAARLTPPAGSGVLDLFGPQSKGVDAVSHQLFELDRVRVSRPVKEVSVGYDRAHSVYSDLGALWTTDATRAELVSKEYRRSLVSDAATATKHKLAETITLDTILRDQTNAETVAEEIRAARGAWIYQGSLRANNAVLSAMELGARVDMTDTRFEPAGASLVVRQVSHDLNAGQINFGARE